MSLLSVFQLTIAPYVAEAGGEGHHGPVLAEEIPARYGGTGPGCL